MKSLILRKNLWKTIPDLWKTLGRSVDNCRVLKAEDKKMAQQQKLGGLIFGGCSRLLLPICERANGVHMYRAFLAVYRLSTGCLLVKKIVIVVQMSNIIRLIFAAVVSKFSRWAGLVLKAEKLCRGLDRAWGKLPNLAEMPIDVTSET